MRILFQEFVWLVGQRRLTVKMKISKSFCSNRAGRWLMVAGGYKLEAIVAVFNRLDHAHG